MLATARAVALDTCSFSGSTNGPVVAEKQLVCDLLRQYRPGLRSKEEFVEHNRLNYGNLGLGGHALVDHDAASERRQCAGRRNKTQIL